MAIETTSTLTDSIRAQYKSKYLDWVKYQRLYDQLAVPYTELGADGMTMEQMMMGSSIVVPFISVMAPGVTAVSQTADVTPQVLQDTTASITPTSRGEALQWAENLDIQAYTDYADKRLEILAENCTESIEILAIDVATTGTWVERATTRSSLDAGTVSHRASDSIFRKFDAKFQSLKVPGYVDVNGVPGTFSAIMHPYVFHDISESGNVDAIGIYQDAGIHLNWEVGKIGNFRLVSSAWAKVFGAAGIANGSNDMTSSINGVHYPLDTTILLDDDESANITYGELWWIGTVESSSTNYPTNEPFKPLSASTYTVTINGIGPNGGLRYQHATTDVVENNDSVYTIIFGGPQSMVKVFATNVGPFGQIIGPKTQGLLDQFNSIGWKFYGNYGLISQNRIMRWEGSTSYEA